MAKLLRMYYNRRLSEHHTSAVAACGVSVMGPTSETSAVAARNFGRSRALTLSMEMDGRPDR